MRTSEFRAEYRVTEVGRRYRGWVHFAVTTTGALAAATGMLACVHAVRRRELAVPIAGFLFANALEYVAHRGPMHHRTERLATMFRRHAQLHHRFFVGADMAYDTPRDFKPILFGPVMLLLVLGAFALPPAVLLGLLASANAGLLFGITVVLYFMLYECSHLAYHSPERSRLARLPGIQWLRRRHLVHHDPRKMTRWNFNITFPICDWLCGTSWRE